MNTLNIHSSGNMRISSDYRRITSVFAGNRKNYFDFCCPAIRDIMVPMKMEYKNALEEQKREMQIMLIRENHPVYRDFNFSRYSNQKVAEMYKVLVESHHRGGNGPEAQTKV
jgi:hypothetical protein